MKRFSLMLAALAAVLFVPAAVAVPAHAVVVPGGGSSPNVQQVAPAQDHQVKVADSDRDPQKWVWVPDQVTIKVGDTVTWNMVGAQVPHTATADNASWDSGYINPGSTWTHKFTAVGDVPYHCTPHPWKKGVIHVTP
jgi:plastocyanin